VASPASSLRATIARADLFALMPDQRRAVVCRADRAPRARLVSLEDGTDLATFEGLGENIRGIAVDADGSRIAFAGMARRVDVCNPAEGTREKFTVEHGGELVGVVFLAGNRLLHASWRDLLILDLQAEEPAAPLTVVEGDLFQAPMYADLAFHPDGSTLAVAWHAWETNELELRCLTFLSWPGGEILRRIDQVREPGGLAYSPDGQHLYVMDRRGGVAALDAGDGRLVWQVREPPARDAYGKRVSLSPDGKILAFALDGILELWDPHQRKPLTRLPRPGIVDDLRFTSEGRLVLRHNQSIEVHDVAAILAQG
jgi:WD40 repeat protein